MTDWGDDFSSEEGDTMAADTKTMSDAEALAAAKGGDKSDSAIIDEKRANELMDRKLAEREARQRQEESKRELDNAISQVCADEGLGDDEAIADAQTEVWRKFTADVNSSPDKYKGKSASEVKKMFAEMTKKAIDAKRRRWGGAKPAEDEGDEGDQAEANEKARESLGQKGGKTKDDGDDDAPSRGKGPRRFDDESDLGFAPPAFNIETKGPGDKQVDFVDDLKKWGKSHGVSSRR